VEGEKVHSLLEAAGDIAEGPELAPVAKA
jgi:hypothetical protein